MLSINIKKYMAESADKLTTSLVRVPYAMLEALGVHAVNYDPAEYDKYRDALRKGRIDLEGAKNSTDILQATGGIVRTIEAYNRGVARHIELRAQEMNSVVSLLMGKLQELAEGKGKSAENLRIVGQKLEKAAGIRDVRILKKELAESLQGVQQEAAHQQEQSAAIRTQAGELKSNIGLPAISPADRDPATGLPGPSTAELAMQAAIASHVHAYVALFAIGLGSITRRHGYEVGDRAFASFGSQIASHLGTGDLLFRWKGPTLVAIMERPGSNEAAPPEMKGIAALRPELSLEIDGKNVNIPLAMSSISFRLWTYDSLQAVRQVLDQCQNTIARDPVQPPATAAPAA